VSSRGDWTDGRDTKTAARGLLCKDVIGIVRP